MTVIEARDPIEISVTLEKYTLFSSNSEVTFTIKCEDIEPGIDRLLYAIQYFSEGYKDKISPS